MENKIEVEFINVANNEVFATTVMEAKQLPESFEIATTLNIQNDTWSVVEAIPRTSDEFIAKKHLVLKLSKIESVDPKEILFSLPTLSNVIGKIGEHSLFKDFQYEIHEDQWRQYEFINTKDINLVHQEIASIQDIRKNHCAQKGEFNAFDQCHIRTLVDDSNLYLDFETLTKKLNTSRVGSLKYLNSPNVVAQAFVLKTDHTVYYGIVENNVVLQLCIADFSDKTIEEIHEIIDTFDVLFVDWCNGEIIN